MSIFPDWETIFKFVQSLGLFKGTFVLFFWASHIWIFMLYRGRLNDRQKQIDNLAKENKEYRDRFLELMDKHFGYTGSHALPSNNQSKELLPPASPTTESQKTVAPQDERRTSVKQPEGKNKGKGKG